jgi:hypothetical protein
MSISVKKTALLCILSLCVAALLFALWKEWIIIHVPYGQIRYEQKESATKKQVTLWYWSQNRWHNEKTELLWSQKMSENISQLVSALLVLLEEEKLIDKKTTIQSVALSGDGLTAFISFDRAPLAKQASVYIKWMTIEALLKTLRENGITLQQVQFLVHHQPMQDMYLDFSHPWSISGFKE